jgi:iron complex transport system substrate-binding protein
MAIISVAPSNTEIIYRLGAEEDLVATTSLCDHPSGARELPSVGGWTDGIQVEKIVELQPDLILASDDLQDDIVEELEEQSLNVLQVKPHNLEEVYDSIVQIGELLDRAEEAEELVGEMKSSISGIDLQGKRIYCEEWMEPPMVSGNWIPGLIETANGEYFIDEGERSREFDLEKLKEFDPEYIFLNVCGAGENIDKSEILNRENWKELTAVKEENVFVIDDALLNRPGPRLVDGLKRMEDVVHQSGN